MFENIRADLERKMRGYGVRRQDQSFFRKRITPLLEFGTLAVIGKQLAVGVAVADNGRRYGHRRRCGRAVGAITTDTTITNIIVINV